MTLSKSMADRLLRLIDRQQEVLRREYFEYEKLSNLLKQSVDRQEIDDKTFRAIRSFLERKGSV